MQAVCEYAVSSLACLFVLKMILIELLVGVVVGFSGVCHVTLFCGKRVSHNLSPVLLKKPVSICLLFLYTMRSFLLSTMVQQSCHSCPSDIKLWWRLSKFFVFVALSHKVDIDKFPCWCACMHEWFGRIVMVVGGLFNLVFFRIDLSCEAK